VVLIRYFTGKIFWKHQAAKNNRWEGDYVSDNETWRERNDQRQSLIRDYLNVTQSFSAVADRLHKDEKSIRRMLSPNVG
jgi:hypothetical protein